MYMALIKVAAVLIYFCLFGLRLYVPVNNFSVMSGRNVPFKSFTVHACKKSIFKLCLINAVSSCYFIKNVYLNGIVSTSHLK